MIRLPSLLTLLLCMIVMGFLSAQYPNHKLPQQPEAWNARWITHPEVDQTVHAVIHFRNQFELPEIPERFIVHVSGDNRYRLYVNGTEVGYGPQLGDLRHWRYETLDLAPYLRRGVNTIAAAVVNWGVERSYGIISFKTAFLLQGHGPPEQIANTTYDSQWKVYHNAGVRERPVNWRGGGEIIGGFYAANPTDSIIAERYPWGWERPDYDDKDWLVPEVVFSQPKTSAGAGHGWILQPRTTAIQTNERESMGRVVRSDYRRIQPGSRPDSASWTIPARSRFTILLDRGYVTLGYPKLRMSKGRDAEVKITYSEALYDSNFEKGNRNEIDGKTIRGISDVYRMDGGPDRIFQPLWFRTFRFIQLEIRTGDEPLVIEDYHNVFSAAAFPLRARFETEDPDFARIWDLCWHGLRICAQDNLLSDAYYEQLQYVGDLRPHLQAWTALTGDFTYFRSALEQFNNSRLPDGNITSCYPLKATFVHPTYSLIWIDMLYDWMMLTGERKELEGYRGEIEEVFDYYESLINEKGLVGKSDYLMFVDWYVPKGGNSPVNRNGNSAILTLNYAYSLMRAAAVMDYLGYRDRATVYRDRSRKYAETVRRWCYDEQRGYYADDPERTFFDQRASILAILCGAHTLEEERNLLEKVLDESTPFDGRANLFYYFYLFEAMEKTGRGDFARALEPWRDMLKLGMSGTPEKRMEQNPRSEIHPWTAHPVHYYFTVVAGIQPLKPGFGEVRIRPNPGGLKTLTTTYPSVRGDIRVDLRFSEAGGASGTVILPENTTGLFSWKGVSQSLRAGENTVSAGR